MNELVPVAVFIVPKDGKILVEKRKLTKKIDPGKVVIPGGHVDPGETLEQTVKRELKEELDLDCDKFEFIISLRHKAVGEDEMAHYFACLDWSGEIKVDEAEEVFWLGPDELNKLDYDVDRKAAREFFSKFSENV